MMADRAQRRITADPVCSMSPPRSDTHATPHARVNMALFSLQSKTCHFICPSLGPNHSDGQEREGGSVTASSVKVTAGRQVDSLHPVIFWCGLESGISWFTSNARTPREKQTLFIACYEEFRVNFRATVLPHSRAKRLPK